MGRGRGRDAERVASLLRARPVGTWWDSVRRYGLVAGAGVPLAGAGVCAGVPLAGGGVDAPLLGVGAAVPLEGAGVVAPLAGAGDCAGGGA